MRVLFLGAGASIAAGYPPASKLLKEIEALAKQSPNLGRSEKWEQFESYRKNATGILREVLYSSNPEIALSQLDLLLATRAERFQHWRHRLEQASGGEEMEALLREPRPLVDEPPELSEVRQAIRGLEDCLDDYFSWKHFQDSSKDRSTPEHLRKELASLVAGDVILTTNWDTLAERTLSELGLWYPTDGYGIVAPLEPYGLPRPELPLRDLRSQVQVLKLHGSVGWHSLPRKRSWYLRFAKFLQFLPVEVDGEQVLVKDPRETQRPYGWHESYVLIRPSYLKSLGSPALQEVWRLAKEALDSATEVKVIGYSLPESDSAVRALLNPLRGRLERGLTSVKITDPDRQALSRWKELLGSRAKLMERSFGPA